jgi:putative colanic acid biosynthesis acetyltransferase WcaF
MGERLYVDTLSRRHKLARLLWNVVYLLVYCWLPKPCFGRWRIFLLKLFGAKIGKGCSIAPSCRIWAPWNMNLSEYVCLAEGVDFYCVSPIRLEAHVTVSQRAFLCSASHDISLLSRPLIHSPIVIQKHAWVCAEAFVGTGVTIAEGAVLGARSVAMKDIEPWAVVAGIPAKFVKTRVISDSLA